MEAGAHISYSEAKAKAEEDRLQNQELKKKKQQWLRKEQERLNGETSVRARNRYGGGGGAGGGGGVGGDALGAGLGGPFAQSDLYAEPDAEPRFPVRAKELDAIEKDGAARALSDPQSCRDMLLGPSHDSAVAEYGFFCRR